MKTIFKVLPIIAFGTALSTLAYYNMQYHKSITEDQIILNEIKNRAEKYHFSSKFHKDSQPISISNLSQINPSKPEQYYLQASRHLSFQNTRPSLEQIQHFISLLKKRRKELKQAPFGNELLKLYTALDSLSSYIANL